MTAVATAVPFVSTLAPSERAKALGAAVEVDFADIPPGGVKPTMLASHASLARNRRSGRRPARTISCR